MNKDSPMQQSRKDAHMTMTHAGVDPHSHQRRVWREMKELGVTRYGMATTESDYIPRIVHLDEHLRGVIYGKHEEGFVMMIATDQRLLFLDKKPLYVNQDEINYDFVSGVSIGKAGLSATVTVHTRIKDYAIRTFNRKCAQGFVDFIESYCLETNKHSAS